MMSGTAKAAAYVRGALEEVMLGIVFSRFRKGAV
jgi:hypothetical protein